MAKIGSEIINGRECGENNTQITCGKESIEVQYIYIYKYIYIYMYIYL